MTRLPDPYDPWCKRYAADMAELDHFWADSPDYTEEDKQRERAEYIRNEEGTYNRDNGHFLCDACYIAVGMPSSPGGWVCP